jgi:SAM-dependent methyltransferase
MRKTGTVRVLLLFFLLMMAPFVLIAQKNSTDTVFVPRVGQPGKDVIWVPTPDELVKKMLEVSEVSDKDYVIDLGSGDGRTVIAAAKLGARALGIEFNPDMVAISRKNAADAGVGDRASFIQADLFEYDLSGATVITMFLLPEINLRLRPRLLDLKPGTRIVSNTFTMADWEPDFEVTTEDNWNSWYNALMWIVPAKIGGTWQLDHSQLILDQKFQMLNGSFISGNKIIQIREGRIAGDSITFRIDNAAYSGHFDGNATMRGTLTEGTLKKTWCAIRTTLQK